MDIVIIFDQIRLSRAPVENQALSSLPVGSFEITLTVSLKS